MAVLIRKYTLLLLIVLLGAMPLLALPKIVYPAASVLLPGSGELLLGEYTRGGTLMAIDLLSVHGFVDTNKEIDRQRESYMSFASMYAGVPYGMPTNHYQAVQDFISSDYYNDIQEMMARNYYLIYNYDPASYADYLERNTFTGDEAWNWGNEANWKEYKNMRLRHQRTKMSHNFALGIMLFNRAVSAIDSALLSRRLNGAVYVTPSGLEGAMLNYKIEF